MGGGLERRCVFRVYGADGTVRPVARHHPDRTHDLRNGSQDHHQSTNSSQKPVCCNITSSSLDDRHMPTTHVDLRIQQ